MSWVDTKGSQDSLKSENLSHGQRTREMMSEGLAAEKRGWGRTQGVWWLLETG